MEILQPKLRFPEFKGDWNIKQLGDVGDVKMCRRIFNEETTTSGEIPFFKIGSFGKVADAFITKELYLNYRNKFSFPKIGDILISAAGTIGRTVVYNGEDAYFQDSNIVWIDNNNTITLNEFLFYIYQKVSFNTEGGTIQRLYNNILKSTKFYNTSIPEQTKIANFLSSVDEKLNLLKEKKALLEEYKKGIMQKIFNQEIRFKDDDGNDFEEWEKKKFSKYIKLYRGSSPRPIIKYITDSESGVNWIKIGDTKKVNNYIIENVSEKITLDGAKHSRKVDVGEIILANSMSFGKSYILNISGCIYDGWFVLREYEDFFHKMFLIQLLNSDFLQHQYNILSTGGVVQNISSEIVYSTFLLKPPLEEQTKIANFLSAIDEKIELVSTQIEDTQEYKKGLLQQMFV